MSSKFFFSRSFLSAWLAGPTQYLLPAIAGVPTFKSITQGHDLGVRIGDDAIHLRTEHMVFLR